MIIYIFTGYFCDEYISLLHFRSCWITMNRGTWDDIWPISKVQNNEFMRYWWKSFDYLDLVGFLSSQRLTRFSATGWKMILHATVHRVTPTAQTVQMVKMIALFNMKDSALIVMRIQLWVKSVSTVVLVNRFSVKSAQVLIQTFKSGYLRLCPENRPFRLRYWSNTITANRIITRVLTIFDFCSIFHFQMPRRPSG